MHIFRDVTLGLSSLCGPGLIGTGLGITRLPSSGSGADLLDQ